MMESRQPQHNPWPGGSEGGGGGSNRNSGSSTQSRFVEGSMNDRASAAPPPNFLGPNEVAAFERQFYSPADAQDGGLGRVRQSLQHYPPRSNREFYQRRPLSSSGPSHRSSQPQLHTAQPQQPQQPQPQLQTRRSGFLAPFLDGVREKLSLSRSKSSGSIGRVFSKDKGPAPPPVEETPPAPMENPEWPSVTVTPGDTTGYPTREEVMESYKNLVASGFFQAHAIQGTRHPPRQGGRSNNQAPSEAPAVPPHTSHGPPVSLKSFSQHLASAGAQNHRSSVPGFPYGANNQSGAADISHGAPPPPQTRPPPPPAFMQPPRAENDIPSPQRGTKRGMPIDSNEIEASSTGGGARKLVKKLRRSTSRASVDFNLNGSKHNPMTRPRPSTSSAAPPSIYLTRDTPRPSVSSNTNVPPPSSSGFGSSAAPSLAGPNNPFYITPASFAPPPVGTQTPPPKRKNKLMKLASNKESTGRRIIGTLGFGGLRRVPSTSAKQAPPPLQHQVPAVAQEAPPPIPRPTITKPAAAPVPTPEPVLAPAMLLPPAIIDDARRSFGDTDTGDDEGDNYDSDAMVIDSPPPVVRQATMAKAMVAPAPSAFHYPQRQRTTRPLTSSATTGHTFRDIRTAAPSTSISRSGDSIKMLSSAASGEGAFNASQHHRHGSISPNKKFVTTTALSPPPRMKSGKETTPTKNHVIVKPMSPSNGNVSSRDSGLGHGHGYSHGFNYDGDGGDQDMENCPPPNVPTGPASSSYVW